MTDRRPELSAKLQRLAEGAQWVTWRGGSRLKLEAIPEEEDFTDGRMAVFVHRGRFGYGRVTSHDSGRFLTTDNMRPVSWLTGKHHPQVVWLKNRDALRALVTEEHER